jgi:hypothetical protein
MGNKISEKFVLTSEGSIGRVLSVEHTLQDGTIVVWENFEKDKLTDTEFLDRVRQNVKNFNLNCQKKMVEFIDWKETREYIFAKWREERNKSKYNFFETIESYEEDFDKDFDNLLLGRSYISEALKYYDFNNHPSGMYYEEKKQLLEGWRIEEKAKARDTYFGELGKKYREQEETRLKQKEKQRKWEIRKERFFDIVNNILVTVTILLGVGVALLVWGIIYEETGDLTIYSLLDHNNLTLGLIYDNSPLGLLLGWIPAVIAFYIFIALVGVVLSIISNKVIFTVILLWGTIIAVFFAS